MLTKNPFKCYQETEIACFGVSRTGIAQERKEGIRMAIDNGQCISELIKKMTMMMTNYIGVYLHHYDFDRE